MQIRLASRLPRHFSSAHGNTTSGDARGWQHPKSSTNERQEPKMRYARICGPRKITASAGRGRYVSMPGLQLLTVCGLTDQTRLRGKGEWARLERELLAHKLADRPAELTNEISRSQRSTPAWSARLLAGLADVKESYCLAILPASLAIFDSSSD